jgi:hypothetical protein
MNRILALQKLSEGASPLYGDSNQSNQCSSGSDECSTQSNHCGPLQEQGW